VPSPLGFKALLFCRFFLRGRSWFVFPLSLQDFLACLSPFSDFGGSVGEAGRCLAGVYHDFPLSSSSPRCFPWLSLARVPLRLSALCVPLLTRPEAQALIVMLALPSRREDTPGFSLSFCRPFPLPPSLAWLSPPSFLRFTFGDGRCPGLRAYACRRDQGENDKRAETSCVPRPSFFLFFLLRFHFSLRFLRNRAAGAGFPDGSFNWTRS